MPSIDAARLRARLAPADLTVLHRLVTGADPLPALAGRLDALRAAGLVDGERVHPLVAAVVSTVTGAQVLVDVEVSGPDGLSGQGVAIAGDVACVLQAWPDDEEGEYGMATPGLAVPALALAAGIAPAPADRERRPLEAPVRLVDGALLALAQAGTTGWEPAREAAVDVVRAELGADGARLVALLSDLRRCVRFTASGPGRAPRAVVLLDAGGLGYWTRTAPAEPLTADAVADPDLRVVLEPVTPSQVWAALVDLLDER